MILVVGATGHLGTVICRRLATEGYAVRALVRRGSDATHLERMGVELVRGDLRNADSVRAACAQVDAVVATANAALPSRRNTDFDSVEGDGYFNLLRACQRNPLDRIVFLSVPVTPWDDLVPGYRYKRINEDRVRRSGVPFTIIRSAPFMDDCLALIGSRVPLRGGTIHGHRRHWFSRAYMALLGRLVDGPGVALIPGDGWTRHAFVAVEDVAGYTIEALFSGTAEDRTLNLGGPEILSWNEAVDACGRVAGRTLGRIRVPATALRLQQLCLARAMPHVSNLMGRLWIQSQWETPYQPSEARPVLDTRALTTVEQFFRGRSALAPV